MGMLDASVNSEEAFIILSSQCPSMGQSSVLDLALELKMKRFLNHNKCTQLTSIWWHTPR